MEPLVYFVGLFGHRECQIHLQVRRVQRHRVVIKQFQIFKLSLYLGFGDIVNRKFLFWVVGKLRVHLDVSFAAIFGEVLGQEVFEVGDVNITCGEDV